VLDKEMERALDKERELDKERVRALDKVRHTYTER
jgi:hypothetical protein